MSQLVVSWVIYAAWILLVIYLIFAALDVKPDKQRHLGQSFALTAAIIVSFLLPHVHIFRFVNFAPVNTPVSAIGIFLSLGGIALLVWARQVLGRNWSQTVSAKVDQELVTNGPYRYIRHPMYSGGLIAAIGSMLAIGGPFVFLVILLGSIFIWRVGAEDRLMERQFPVEFPKYKRKTKKLIPFIW